GRGSQPFLRGRPRCAACPRRSGAQQHSIRILDERLVKRSPTLARAVTLFTGQWADLPFEDVARLAAEWGYDGLEIACWGDHLDPNRGATDDAYIAERKAVLDKHGL